MRPRDAADVQKVLRFATEHNVSIVPWGLGSGVCGGIEPHPNQILIDMSAMNQVLSIDEDNLLLTVEAGINGLIAEEVVAERGANDWPLATIDWHQLGGRMDFDPCLGSILNRIRQY